MAESREFDAVAWAIKALRDENRLRGYRDARKYYNGKHPLAFATEQYIDVFAHKFGAVTDNLCPAVVDAISDRLKITGVGYDEKSGGTQAQADRAWEIWQRNRMDVRAPETHHEALLTGDGYALVWPNEVGEVVIWPIPAEQMVVSYDPNKPGVIRRAARVWQDDEDSRVHLDVYYDDRVERFVTRNARKTILGTDWSVKDFVSYVPAGGLDSESVMRHRGERVPVVHFPNGRYHSFGISELAIILPLQDALNKTLSDMLVAQEFSAYPQRYATGVDWGEVDEKGKVKAPPADYGVNRLLTVASDLAKFGAFPTSDLRQYVEVQENLRAEIARVSGTPLHYLFITKGDYPSGEAMKSAEARFTHKVEQRQEAFGNQWEDLLALALRMEDNTEVDGAALSLQWETAAPTALAAGQPTLPNAPPDDSQARSAAQPIGGRDE